MGILLSQAKEKSMEFKEKFEELKRKLTFVSDVKCLGLLRIRKTFCVKKKYKRKKGKMMKKEKGNKESGFRKSEKKNARKDNRE